MIYIYREVVATFGITACIPSESELGAYYLNCIIHGNMYLLFDTPSTILETGYALFKLVGSGNTLVILCRDVLEKVICSFKKKKIL